MGEVDGQKLVNKWRGKTEKRKTLLLATALLSFRRR